MSLHVTLSLPTDCASCSWQVSEPTPLLLSQQESRQLSTVSTARPERLPIGGDRGKSYKCQSEGKPRGGEARLPGRGQSRVTHFRVSRMQAATHIQDCHAQQVPQAQHHSGTVSHHPISRKNSSHGERAWATKLRWRPSHLLVHVSLVHSRN